MSEIKFTRCLHHKYSTPFPPFPLQNLRDGDKIALEGLYVQATGEEFNPPEPVCERDMRALEALFEALHGEPIRTRRVWVVA